MLQDELANQGMQGSVAGKHSARDLQDVAIFQKQVLQQRDDEIRTLEQIDTSRERHIQMLQFELRKLSTTGRPCEVNSQYGGFSREQPLQPEIKAEAASPVVPVYLNATPCALCVPSMHPLCAPYGPSMNPLCALCAPSMWPLCALYAPSMRPLCALQAPSMRPSCALYAPFVHQLCTHYAPTKRPLCAPMRPLCALYAPSRHPL